MHRAGPRLAQPEQRGNRQEQNQQAGQQHRQHGALAGAYVIGALQREAPLHKQGADKNTDGKAHKAHQRVAVAAGQPQHHPQGAAQESQSANHHKAAQYKPERRRRAGLGPELSGGHSHDKSAQHQTDNLRPHILHLVCAVHSQGPRDVPQETGDAEAHVGRITKGGQQHRSQSHSAAGQNNEPIYFFHRNASLSDLPQGYFYCIFFPQKSQFFFSFKVSYDCPKRFIRSYGHFFEHNQ